jgi:hypothetical protein
MRQNWNNYEVYKIRRQGISFQRGAAAFLYKNEHSPPQADGVSGCQFEN